MVFHNKFVAFFSFSWTYADVIQIREIDNVNHTFIQQSLHINTL